MYWMNKPPLCILTHLHSLEKDEFSFQSKCLNLKNLNKIENCFYLSYLRLVKFLLSVEKFWYLKPLNLQLSAWVIAVKILLEISLICEKPHKQKFHSTLFPFLKLLSSFFQLLVTHQYLQIVRFLKYFFLELIIVKGRWFHLILCHCQEQHWTQLWGAKTIPFA